MTNNDFSNNIGIKCNKKEAYKFIEWYKANGLSFAFSDNPNTPEMPWNFKHNKDGFIYYYIGCNLSYSSSNSLKNYKYITFKEFVIKHKLLAIEARDDIYYNRKIINYLESIGGVNKYNCNGYTEYGNYYYISDDNKITCKRDVQKYIKFTLEELMEEQKEVRIEIPEGYEIDESRSTFTNIVFKLIKLTYNKIAEKLFKNNKTYFTNSEGRIDCSDGTGCQFAEPNNCTSKQQAEKLLAMNKLMNVAKYLNGDWTPNWNDEDSKKYRICINHVRNEIRIDSNSTFIYSFVYFKSKELAEQAIDILGEETIRTALSTDW